MSFLDNPRRDFASIDSTNRYALDWLDAPHGALVVADEQSAGRGRLGRVWKSPAGKGLYFSLVLLALNPVTRARISLLAGLCVARAVENETRLNVRLKWPNDILVGNFKIGGILCETREERTVVGIGLNLSHEADDLPVRALFPASSLLLLSGRRFERDTILNAILREFDIVLQSPDVTWPKCHFEITQRLFGRGELVRAGGVLGLIQGLGDNGELRLQGAGGVVLVRSGEVEFL